MRMRAAASTGALLAAVLALALAGLTAASGDGDRVVMVQGADEADDGGAVFMEVDVGAMGQAGAANDEELDCTCEAFACDCKKECLCRITEDAFQGRKEVGPDKERGAAKHKGKDPVTFKCGCDFGSSDFSMAKGQGLDCDCSAAKCTCGKKCTCRSTKAPAAQKPPKAGAKPPAKPPAAKFSERDDGGDMLDGDDAAADQLGAAPRRLPETIRLDEDNELRLDG